MRNETFRMRPLKSLKSLGAANQPFRRFVQYQGFAADFVSPRFRAISFAAVFGLRECQSLARRVEAAEPILHLVDLVANALEGGLEAQPLGRKAVQMVEDADEGMRG